MSLDGPLCLAAIFLIILFVAAITHVLTKRAMVRSFAGLSDSVKEIGSGNLTVLLERNEKEEKKLEEFYGALNEMTGRLLNTITKLTYSATNIDSMAGEIFRETKGLKDIASAQKNFSGEVSVSVEDVNCSIQEISESIESLKMAASESLQGLSELNEDAEVMTKNVAELKGIVDKSIVNVVEMSKYVTEAAKDIVSLESYGRKTVFSVKEIEGAVRQIEKNAGDAGQTTEQLYSDAREGARDVDETIKGITSSRDIIASSSTIMEEVGERSDEIGDVINIINSIADRTKLLALNASIIASEAGEYGKGFAVVADEIEKLSNMTTSSTAEIAEIVRGLQEWSGKGVDSMKEGLLSIDESVALAQSAGVTLNKILDSSQKASGAAGEIVNSTKEQSREVAKALESMESTKSMIEKISETAQNEAAKSGKIMSFMSDVQKLMDKVKGATEKRTGNSVMMAESFEVVNDMLYHIINASQRQKETGKIIVEGVQNITESSGANYDSAEKLNKLVQPLKELSEILKEDVGNFKV